LFEGLDNYRRLGRITAQSDSAKLLSWDIYQLNCGLGTARLYGVDTDAVALKVKQEFAAKEKARKATNPELRPTAKAKRAA
jgi:hypothetical protein